MKRMWFGAALLAVLLIMGVITARRMEALHGPVSGELAQASQWALEENWQQAEQCYCSARLTWQRRWHLTAALADHTPMEEIDSLFAEVEVFARSREAVHFAAGCAQLARQIRAMGDAHSMDWWNLL